MDLEFGTGALKITPGHDPADYEIGQTHDLEIINVLNPDATMNRNAGPYEGLDRYECREKLWVDMEAAGIEIVNTICDLRAEPTDIISIRKDTPEAEETVETPLMSVNSDEVES